MLAACPLRCTLRLAPPRSGAAILLGAGFDKSLAHPPLVLMDERPSELRGRAVERGNTTRAGTEKESICRQLTTVPVMSSMPQRVPSPVVSTDTQLGARSITSLGLR
jgi:hypothetical protein